ncbi:beta-glucosidase [Frondihabitans sp. PhB188]|uniref:glycoside hydrolase family 3 protein n=1 Tax=Frondihabitans sp. PhB188 TaxID=2485200 RepID=UPI000F4807A5|nr:glycoside hydrolase family 3 N-terminal domain-containing protein [Frondihabitans sp. PhB188]ROQ41502.1 beta-glucosidase [Frondihabitans sp. PhB188]
MTDAAIAHPYQDASVDIDQRVDDLLSRLDTADKVGLLFHSMAALGDPTVANPAFGLPSLQTMVVDQRMNHFNLLGAPGSGREFAQWLNVAQRLAVSTPLGIPISFSTDPRHAFTDNPGTAMMAGPFSQWPETLGLAAIRSPELVERFADMARREYLAVGLRVALHPQIDLATEPRWSRANGTFGEDADLTSELVVAYIRGFQGESVGPESVSTMTKHFPGGGPQKDGEDPHFAYGREQVYPGGMFEQHLKPFEAAFAAGGSQIMPYYGMPVGTQYEEVGFSFNKQVITGLLRERYGFDGVVCTDWGLLTDADIMGTMYPARAWGVEDLSREERALKALEAGVDQFGGELCTDVVLGLATSGRLPEARLDVSVRRLLREKFRLGLFENPFVDEERAAVVVGNDEFVAAGAAAQRASLTLLVNDGLLPLAAGAKVYGLPATALEGHGTAVDDPAEADVAILRVKAPFEARGEGFEAHFHAGSLDFAQAEIDRITAIAATVPTVLDVYLDRPAILTPFAGEVGALVADYGCSDENLVAVLFGDESPQGALPFDLPRSMAAVEASREDVAFDTVDPLFRFGHGLRY